MTADLWTPPDEPDPSQIMDEAVADTRHGNYELALLKLRWCYENALRYDPHLAGVRSSFLLGYWHDLGKKYPPALDALRQTRDQAEVICRESNYAFHPFQDLASLNRQLGDRWRTAHLFKQVSQADREAAALIYGLAEPYLIEFGDFAACDPYLELQPRLGIAAEQYRLQVEFEADYDDEPHSPPKVARRFYLDDVTALISLLIRNGRHAEAKQAYAIALETIDDAEFRESLDGAMRGRLPESLF